MDLIEALAALDSEDDAHWTGQGLPMVDVVKEKTGDSSVTRAAIDEAAPDYTRVNRFDLGVEGNPMVDGPPEVPQLDAPKEQPSSPLLDPSSDNPDIDDSKMESQDNIEQMEREVEELTIQGNLIQNEISSLTQKLEAARIYHNSLYPAPTAAETVMRYQKRGLEERIRVAKETKEAMQALGLPGSSGRVGMSRLDVAMAMRRRGRPSTRNPSTLAGKE